ncbi:MAG: transposase [Alphaproteobacteria bacterium]|nr:transposase [Alphaproteobacteria bacterium]
MKILLRADSGFARDGLMSWAEANNVDFLFGLARNSRLVEHIHDASARTEQTLTGATTPRPRRAGTREKCGLSGC